MKPLTKIAETSLPGGKSLELWERDASFFLLEDGMQVASSFSHGSEDMAAELAAAPVRRANQPVFLIEGLGLGFFLSGAMNCVGREKASFIVAEPCNDLIAWNETFLDSLHPGMIQDPRVSVEGMKALDYARRHSKALHAILIKSTHARYNLTIGEASDYFGALKQGGLLVIIVSRHDDRLSKNLQKAGFEVAEEPVPSAHKGKKTNFNSVIIAKKGRFVPFSARQANS